MRFEIFLGRNYLYYFRYIAANGQIIVTSGEVIQQKTVVFMQSIW